MAIEIAVRTCGKGRNSLKQAIFINESELDGPLSEVRTIIVKQDVELPQDYRFLTRSGNVIPWAIEETLILREVALSGSKANYNKNEQQDHAVKLETTDSEDAHTNDGVKVKVSNVSVPELWIATHGDVLDSSSDDANNGNEQDATEERHRNMAMYSQLCPWKAFVNFSQDGNGSRNFFKLMFFLVAVLFLLLASLVLTTHVVFGLLSTVTSHPEFNSLFSRLKSDGSSTEEITNLRLKVSELELSWKFKFDQLNGKLTELEDLYINDLAKHKREMASLRNQNVDISGKFATHKDLEMLQAKVDEMSEYVKTHQEPEAAKTQHGKKKAKKNKGREGL